jgi:hypothetical protein
MPFKVGDKVKTKTEGRSCPSRAVGTVMVIEHSIIGVYFEGWGGGHSLGGELRGNNKNSGWFIRASALSLVAPATESKEDSKEDTPLIKKIKYLEHKFKTRHNPVEKKEEEWYDF